MKAKRNRHGYDDKAVTVAQDESAVVTGSSYGDVSWSEWCKREMARLNASCDGGKVRIAKGDGKIWLTRG